MSQSITLVHLYARDMNIYGDHGNVLTLERRIKWHGYDVKTIPYNPGDSFPADVDIVLGGGGQDSGQDTIMKDLLEIGPRLKDLAEDGVPMLMVCGLYQLFGKFFKTQDGHVIKGISLLDCQTYAGNERLIGNTIVESEGLGQILGYENHSGQTFLGPNAKPFARVIKGAGNNGKDETEGARYKNVIGTYLHGPILPKNPELADFLIEQAVLRKHGEFTPTVVDDSLALEARKIAAKRPR
jgi:CobQ-like glutamine amidotransferase family enzyme